MGKKHVMISSKFLGGMILAGIIIQYVLPRVGIRGLDTIALIMYLIVGLYLLFFN
jgi:hypothetical protein